MHDSDIEKELKSSLDKLGDNGIQTPDIPYFSRLIAAEKSRKALKQKRQLTAFVFLSVFIVAAAIFCLLKSVTVYLILQGVALAVFCILLTCVRKKEVSRL